jgi:glycosyltransferase involved in cell wall biosynthesis
MRILFIMDALRRGGKERRIIELLKFLDVEKIDYRLVLIRSQISYPISKEIEDKIVFVNKKRSKSIRPFFKIFSAALKFKPLIIHTWGTQDFIYAFPTKIFLRTKLVNSQIMGSPPIETINWYNKFMNLIIFHFSDIIVSNSRAGVETFNPPKIKTHVIYNGVDPNRFVISESRQDVKKKNGIVTMVASFTPEKGYHKFLDLAIYFMNQRDDTTFIFVGDGPNLKMIQTIAKEQKVSNILFLGQVDNVEEILYISDIGVLISPLGEGLSNSILEYMAMCLPVVASKIGGNPELVTDGVNGFLIEGDDFDEYCKKISLLLDNPTLREKMGAIGNKMFMQKHNVFEMGKKFLTLYQEL